MKFITIIAAVLGLAMTQTCTHDLEVRCMDDINKAFPICEKAAQ